MSTTEKTKVIQNTIPQEDDLGCGAACLAVLLKISYKKVISLLNENKIDIKNGLYFKQMIDVLNKVVGKDFYFKHLKDKKLVYKNGMIVYIKRTNKFPFGHFLIRENNMWHDSWINLPSEPIVAGFRKRLPYKPSYFMYFKEKNN
jgi:hypothetical protein